MEQYRTWLVRTARRLARRPSDVDDLAQEGSIAMWRASRTFDPALGAEAGYLTRAALARMRDCARRDLWTGTPGARGHHRERPATPVDTSWDWTHAALADVSEAAQWAYHRGELRAVMDQLRPTDREWVRRILTTGCATMGTHRAVLSANGRALLARSLAHWREEYP